MHRARPWWQSLKGKLDRFDNLSVIVLADDQVAPLPAMAQRTMQLFCTIQDGSITFGDNAREATIVPEVWLRAKGE